VKHAIRGVLEAAGYRLYNRTVLPYDIDFMLDIDRLSRAWDVQIRTFFDVGANEGQTSTSAVSIIRESSGICL
jgi:hypothetical protein